MSKKQEQEKERAEIVARLRKMIRPGSRVHVVLRHVAKSGMSRTMDFYFLKKGESIYLTGYMARLGIGTLTDRGLRVGGCGMDMGFACVEHLSSILWGRGHGYKCLGKYKDGGRRCPSNYHANYRRSIRCEGVKGEGEDWFRCFPSDERARVGIGDGQTIEGGPVYKLDGQSEPCPKCKGKGEYPNPDGPERFDLKHQDGYAISHVWM